MTEAERAAQREKSAAYRQRRKVLLAKAEAAFKAPNGGTLASLVPQTGVVRVPKAEARGEALDVVPDTDTRGRAEAFPLVFSAL